jgi:hypothetical protein
VTPLAITALWTGSLVAAFLAGRWVRVVAERQRAKEAGEVYRALAVAQRSVEFARVRSVPQGLMWAVEAIDENAERRDESYLVTVVRRKREPAPDLVN